MFPADVMFSKPSKLLRYCPYDYIIIGDFNGDLKSDLLCSSRGDFYFLKYITHFSYSYVI